MTQVNTTYYYNTKGSKDILGAFGVGENVSRSTDCHEGTVTVGEEGWVIWEPLGDVHPESHGFERLDLLNYRGWRLKPGFQVVLDVEATELHCHWDSLQYASDRAAVLNARIKAAGGPEWDSL